RLPKCLPPHASDPTAYHLGIITYGQIFVALELGIDRVLSGPLQGSVARERQVRILKTLHTAGLARTRKLKHDTNTLSSRILSRKDPSSADALRQIEDKVRADAVARTRYITERIEQNPYLALAYAWTMYLALFNGGRHIQRALKRPGREFWLTENDTGSDKIDVLSFWHFEAATEEDLEADQLRLEFKSRFDKACQLLTDFEREGVIKEAEGIFELCMELVLFLDGVMVEYECRTQNIVSRTEDKRKPPRASAGGTWYDTMSSAIAPVGKFLGLDRRRPLVEGLKDGDQ
ncbi:hypothetical protein LTR70_008458, partial [Exophiala xenobiotica]